MPTSNPIPRLLHEHPGASNKSWRTGTFPAPAAASSAAPPATPPARAETAEHSAASAGGATRRSPRVAASNHPTQATSPSWGFLRVGKNVSNLSDRLKISVLLLCLLNKRTNSLAFGKKDFREGASRIILAGKSTEPGCLLLHVPHNSDKHHGWHRARERERRRQ